MRSCGCVVQALVKEGSSLLAGSGVVMEMKIVECEGRGGGRGFAVIGYAFSGAAKGEAVRRDGIMRGEERTGRWGGELLKLANPGIRALPESERLPVGREMGAQSFAEDSADIVLRGALSEELRQDKIVVAIGDDAGKVVGFRKDQAVRVVGCGACGIVRKNDWGELIAEGERGFYAGAQVGEILLAGESGGARDEARSNHGLRRIERGAERDIARVSEGDERAGFEIGSLSGGWCRFEVGAIDPEMAGA